MKHAKIMSTILMPLWLIACVTINVYFPAAAAEKAADRIIQDVYGTQPGTKPAPQQPEKKPGDQSSRSTSHYSILEATLNFVIPPAHAQADINISTPAIRALTASMSQRQSQLNPFYSSGAVGMTNNGLITVRNLQDVPLKDRNRLRKLVADENSDRNALYREIAKANGHPEWESEIRQTFAKRWVANAPSGWWYQDSGGNWKQK